MQTIPFGNTVFVALVLIPVGTESAQHLSRLKYSIFGPGFFLKKYYFQYFIIIDQW